MSWRRRSEECSIKFSVYYKIVSYLRLLYNVVEEELTLNARTKYFTSILGTNTTNSKEKH